MIDIYAGKDRIEIGRYQENAYRRVVFPVAPILRQYPDATFVVLNKRKQDQASYPVPVSQITVADGRLYWVLMAADLAYTGEGECELIAYSGSVVAKDVIYTVVVDRALDAGSEPPDGWEDFLADLAEIAETAVDAKNDAVTAKGEAEAAQGAAERAQTAAESAQGLAEGARDAAILAKTAAETAQGQAEGFATAASGSAGEAQRSANAATSKAGEAAQSASDAAGSASDASGYAQTASEKAGEASDSASAAARDAGTAEDKAGEASQSATDASGYATAASGSASSAAADALKSEGYAVGKQNGSDVGSGSPYYHSNAKYYSEQAAGSATTASTKAGEASGSASAASGSATAADGSAKDAEAYAVGKRGGVDVGSTDPAYHNNAKYFSDQIGDVSEQFSELKSALDSKEDKPEAPDSIPLVLGWINSDGSESTNPPSGNYCITDYVSLDDAIAISYTGSIGSSSAVFWYDDEKTFISRDLVLMDRMAWYENVLSLKPSTAKYVRLQSKTLSASNPPPVAPEVTKYLSAKYMEQIMSEIVGDGITDDTLAVQKMVNMCESVIFPPKKKILISSSIHIQLGYSRIIDGNGSLLIVDDDFYALSILGTLNQSSSSTGMNAYVLNSEADTLVTNFRITSDDGISGGGIEATKAFKLKLKENYIYNVANGIRIYRLCRDMMISGNFMHSIYAAGIVFDDKCDLHQCNIVNNILMYAHDIIHFNEPDAVANFQIVGNDMELGSYPPGTYSSARCISMEAASNTVQFSEIEITGNTIQGHGTSEEIIFISGISGHEVEHICIGTNHISNANTGIRMENVENLSISGNNYKDLYHYVFEMDGVCSNVVISGESAVTCGGKIHAASTATLTGVKCKNMQFKTNDTNSIQTNSVTDVDIYDVKKVSVSGSTPSITAVQNASYICGEVSTLSFTPCAVGECGILFRSGSTATVLTIPNAVKWDNEFDPSDLDADTVYEISVINGVYGTAKKWAVEVNLINKDDLYNRYITDYGYWSWSGANDAYSVTAPVAPNTQYTLSGYPDDLTMYRLATTAEEIPDVESSEPANVAISLISRVTSYQEFGGPTKTFTTGANAKYVIFQTNKNRTEEVLQTLKLVVS